MGRKKIEVPSMRPISLFPTGHSDILEVDILCKRGDISFSEKITKLDKIIENYEK